MYITNNLKRRLVGMIDANQYYPVNYTINQDRTKSFTKTYLLGADLTQNQITELWQMGELC